MRIWYQVVSSARRSSHFLAALQAHCDEVAGADVEVLVRGTPEGGFADQHAALLHLDGASILRLADEHVAAEGIDVYALGNVLDPAIGGLREILDVPVVSVMEVATFVASLIGERFGVVAPNARLIPTIRDNIRRYGHGDRIAGMVPLEFARITDMDALFVDHALAADTIESIERQAAALVERGAEVILTPGPIALAIAREGVTELAGAPVPDLYALLTTFAEALGSLRARGVATSRLGRYLAPARADVDAAMRTVWPES